MTDRIASIVSSSLEVKRRFFEAQADGVIKAAALIVEAFKANGKLLIFGNGGSAADAQHIAGEPFQLGLDAELLTCCINCFNVL